MAWHVDSIVVSMDRWSQGFTISWVNVTRQWLRLQNSFLFNVKEELNGKTACSLRDAEMFLAILLR